MHTYTHIHTCHTYHTIHISTCIVLIPKVLKLSQGQTVMFASIQLLQIKLHAPKNWSRICNYDQRFDLHSEQWMQWDGSMPIHNNARTMMVIYSSLCSATYRTACAPHLKTMHLEPPKCASIQIKRVHFFWKNLLVCYLGSFHYHFYTVVYILSLSNRTVPYILAAGTSLPPGRWNSLFPGQSLGYLAMGGSLSRSERERERERREQV